MSDPNILGTHNDFGESPVFALDKFDADSTATPEDVLAYNTQRIQDLPEWQAYMDALMIDSTLLDNLRLQYPDPHFLDEQLLEMAIEDTNVRRAASAGQDHPGVPKPDRYTDAMCAAEFFGLPDLEHIDPKELFRAAMAYTTTKSLLMNAAINGRTINEQRAQSAAAVDLLNLHIPSFEQILRAARGNPNEDDN